MHIPPSTYLQSMLLSSLLIDHKSIPFDTLRGAAEKIAAGGCAHVVCRHINYIRSCDYLCAVGKSDEKKG